MKSAAITDSSATLSESRRAALVKLLADEDVAIYHTVRSKILSYGQTSSGWMQPHTLSSDPILRRRKSRKSCSFWRARLRIIVFLPSV